MKYILSKMDREYVNIRIESQNKGKYITQIHYLMYYEVELLAWHWKGRVNENSTLLPIMLWTLNTERKMAIYFLFFFFLSCFRHGTEKKISTYFFFSSLTLQALGMAGIRRPSTAHYLPLVSNNNSEKMSNFPFLPPSL